MNLELWPDVWHAAEIYAAVVDGQAFMHHGLISPRRQQGRYGVVSSVQYEQQRGDLRESEIEQLGFSLYSMLKHACVS